MNIKTRIFMGLAVVGVVLDQITKIWVRQNLALHRDSIDVIDGFFQLVHVENTGAAFGMLGQYSWSMYVFIPFTLVAVGVLISVFRELEPGSRFMPTSLGLIMAGAVGNFIDRAYQQSVTDFLRFYTDSPSLAAWLQSNLGTTEYPSFNVADIAICVGVGMFVYFEIFMAKKEKAEATEPAPQGA